MEKELIILINIISELRAENESLKSEVKTSKKEYEDARKMWYEKHLEVEDLKNSNNINNN